MARSLDRPSDCAHLRHTSRQMRPARGFRTRVASTVPAESSEMEVCSPSAKETLARRACEARRGSPAETAQKKHRGRRPSDDGACARRERARQRLVLWAGQDGAGSQQREQQHTVVSSAICMTGWGCCAGDVVACVRSPCCFGCRIILSFLGVVDRMTAGQAGSVRYVRRQPASLVPRHISCSSNCLRLLRAIEHPRR
ncbi:hypothetical protein GY45DRAFT_382968 [Cubamyces sp. BRFM 1775]|nr:hypothetical protein GY45DRAFT_382968 [Cubamyces sp. BRFM 1775]